MTFRSETTLVSRDDGKLCFWKPTVVFCGKRKDLGCGITQFFFPWRLYLDGSFLEPRYKKRGNKKQADRTWRWHFIVLNTFILFVKGCRIHQCGLFSSLVVTNFCKWKLQKEKRNTQSFFTAWARMHGDFTSVPCMHGKRNHYPDTQPGFSPRETLGDVAVWSPCPR